MTATEPTTAKEGLVRDRAAQMLGDRVIRGSLAAMISAVGSGGLSLLFWSVMARFSDPATVGVVSAEVSTITFLAGVGSLNLINVFARFLPEAGWSTRRFMLTGYAAALVAGAVVGGGFLLTPLADGLVLGGPVGSAAFVVLVIVSSVFMIQDGGILGLGHPEWIPVENLSVGGVRLALLPLAATALGTQEALLLAWAIPMVLAVPVVNAVLLFKVAPRRAAHRPTLPRRDDLLRFVAIESVTTAVSSSLSAFLPALVKQKFGADAAGFFYVPWTIISMAGVLLSGTLITTVREVVDRPDEAVTTARRSFRLLGVVLFGVTFGCLLLPGVVLWPLGPEYVENGSALLRWIAGSLPASAVILLYWSVCLVRRRAWPVFWMNVAAAAGVIGGLQVLPQSAGLTAVGVLHFAVQTAIALVVLPLLLRGLRTLRRHGVERVSS